MPAEAISSMKKPAVRCSHVTVKMTFIARERPRGILTAGRNLATAAVAPYWRRIPMTWSKKKTGDRHTLVWGTDDTLPEACRIPDCPKATRSETAAATVVPLSMYPCLMSHLAGATNCTRND